MRERKPLRACSRSRGRLKTRRVDAAAPPTLACAPARLGSLDVLRGLCAVIVFLSHWHLWSNFPPRGALEHAVRRVGDWLHDGFTILAWPTGGHHPAVIGFFVLSGFCIHYPFERRQRAGAPEPDWRAYFWRRFLRIMPVYWAACSLGLLFVAAEGWRPSGWPLLQLHAQSSLTDVLVRFSALASLYSEEIFSGNYILTTVTVEIVMYALYPVFYRIAIAGRWRELGLGFVALHILSIALLPYVTPYWIFNSVLMLGVFWYFGAYAAHVFLARRFAVPGWWLLVAWLAFLALKATPHFYGLNLLKQAAWALICTLGLLWIIRHEPASTAAAPPRSTRFLHRLGDLSYTLYAVHTPVMMLATWALLQLQVQDYLVQLTATMLCSVLAILAVHYGIERPFYRRRTETAGAA